MAAIEGMPPILRSDTDPIIGIVVLLFERAAELPREAAIGSALFLIARVNGGRRTMALLSLASDERPTVCRAIA
jgi:hypothetical protein